MFLHYWALGAGIAAAGLPIAIHLLTKPQPTRLPLSTLRFVREAVRQRRTRSHLRDFLVLLLRTAAVLLIALAIARPKTGVQPLVAPDDQAETVRVVVLDVSQSMAAVDRGVEGIERARSAAAKFLRLAPHTRANLVLAGARADSVFAEPSRNSESLREALSQAKALPERLDVNQALKAAAKQLAPRDDADKRKRELVIISDFQRANWSRADFTAIPKDANIQLETIAPEETPANLAVLDARLQGRSAADTESILEVDLGNFSPTARKVVVKATLGVKSVQLEGTIPARQRTTLSAELRLPEAGWQSGSVQLVNVDDALAADDQRPFAAEVRAKPVFALVTRQSSTRRPSTSHYLECALAPDDAPGESARIVRVHPDQADHDALAAASLIVLDHPGKLKPETIALLANLLRRGRPVLYVAGEYVDAVNLKLLTEAAGGMKLPVDFAPPAIGRQRRNLTLTSYQTNDTPLAIFGDSAPAVLGGLRFAGGLDSKKATEAIAEEIVAEYSDGSACLVMTGGEGVSFAVLNVDLEHSNLPTQGGAFVPLLQELAAQLMDRRAPPLNAATGEALTVRLPPDAGSPGDLTIVGHDSDSRREPEAFGELIEEANGVVWRWPQPSAPGVYRIDRQSTTVFAAAIPLPAEEADLSAVPADTLTERLAADRKVFFRSALDATDERDDLWAWILAGCVGCILAEFGVLIAFRS